MRLIIPIEFYRKGGVERVIIALVSNLVKYTDKIIIILPSKEIAYFQNILPETEAIAYESFSWEDNLPQAKLLGVFNKLFSLAAKLKLAPMEEIITQKIQNLQVEERINYLVEKHQATHCLYVLINRLKPPRVKIPLSGIAYDLFWRFAPLTYPEEYMSKYQESLLMWLEKADIIFTISQKTRTDILTVFPNPKFPSKLKPIPLAGFPTNQTITTHKNANNVTTFYYPSSFGIYKDHLTLLKAGLKLAEKNLEFKIVFLGKETDSFISGKLQLSQQSKTQEYQEYLEECNQIYQNNQTLIEKHFKGNGYCDYQKVEKCYQESSCVVVPSRYEGFGLAVSEAIVRGLPVIASDLEVFKEQIELYNCQDRVELYTQGNVTALAKCLEKFIENPKRKLTQEEIEKRFSHWQWENVAQEYVNTLKLIKPYD